MKSNQPGELAVRIKRAKLGQIDEEGEDDDDEDFDEDEFDDDDE